jgi:hypothetical protein
MDGYECYKIYNLRFCPLTHVCRWCFAELKVSTSAATVSRPSQQPAQPVQPKPTSAKRPAAKAPASVHTPSAAPRGKTTSEQLALCYVSL